MYTFFVQKKSTSDNNDIFVHVPVKIVVCQTSRELNKIIENSLTFSHMVCSHFFPSFFLKNSHLHLHSNIHTENISEYLAHINA